MDTANINEAAGVGKTPVAISLSGISKTFGAVRANRDVSLNIRAGSIHGIVGENGAGKSTLVSILYGFYTADRGSIQVFGEDISIGSTAEAIGTGIGMVHQHFMLVPNFTVLENIILGSEGKGGLRGSMARARAEITRLAGTYGLKVDLDAVVEDLPVGVQQRVEILKALYRGARILILDEPTGVLTPQETDQLFEILRSLKEQGVTVLFITHKLREIMAVTDQVSVMRGGEMVAHRDTSATSPAELAELMVGRPVLIEGIWHAATPGDIVLKAEKLSLEGGGAPLVKELSFDVRAGEILGIAGVSGNGQSELLELLAGIRELNDGQITLGGMSITSNQPASPSIIKALGVAHVPEDRHAMGLVLPFSAAESAILGYEHARGIGDGIWLDPVRLNAHCGRLMKDFDVRPADPTLKSNLFSGGNQQKIVLAREMSANPKLLLVGQPTRGVDIGAIEFIHRQLIALRDEGCAIVLVSVELDEILSLSDRIMVMNGGQSMGIVARKEADARSIGLLMAGVK
ncbi:ABC transporter ATP-binding protein [Alphaproteobacteria bacterium LSUCC0684]